MNYDAIGSGCPAASAWCNKCKRAMMILKPRPEDNGMPAWLAMCLCSGDTLTTENPNG